MTGKRLTLSTMATLLAGFAPAAAQAPSDPSAEMQQHFAEAYNKGDLAAMAAAFTEDAVRVTPSGVFRGREAIRRGFEAALKLGLHDYSVQRLGTQTDGRYTFNVGEWRAKIGSQPLHGYYSAILVGTDPPKIMEETVTVAAP
jgi:ketosteroid isomerase-like protein